MTKRQFTAAGLASILAIACRSERVREPTTFEIHDAWARAVPDSGTATAEYMTFVNGTARRIRITGFSSDAARAVELHRTSIDANGESRMTMTDSISIAPGDTLAMKPGGYHLMLIGTKQPLRPGTMTRTVMHLSDGSILSTSVKVRE